MKCRTCFQVLDLNYSSPLQKKLSIGKTIQEMLLLFIPEMVKSKTVGDFICSNCMDAIQTFLNFIERLFIVEKHLKEEEYNHNLKQQIISEGILQSTYNNISNGNEVTTGKFSEEIRTKHQRENTSKAKDNLKNKYVDRNCRLLKIIPVTIAHQGGAKFVQPKLQLSDEIIKLNRPVRTYSRKDRSSFVLTPKKEPPDPPDCSATDVQTNAHPVIRTLSDEGHVTIKYEDLAATSLSEEFPRTNSFKLFAEKPLSDETMLANFAAIVSKENIANTEDGITLNKSRGTGAHIKALMSVTNSQVSLDHDRVISITRTSEEVADFLKKFPQFKLNLASSQSLSESKRILFLGEAVDRRPECQVSFPSQHASRDHLKQIHPNSVYPEPETKPTFTNVFRFKPLNTCPVCEAQFKTVKLLDKHIVHHHKEYHRFKCEHCDAKFKRKCRYSLHMRRYEMYQDCSAKKCHMCNEIVFKHTYKEHYATHKNIECNICNKKFLRVGHLNSHRLSHQNQTGKKTTEALCPVCGKLLSDRSNLRLHMITHSQKRNHLCDKCSKAFKTISSLKKHMETVHVDTKNYQCAICGKRAKSQSALQLHKRLKHSDVYSHVCHICGKGFNRGDYYRRHIKKHITQGHGVTGRNRKYLFPSLKRTDLPLPCKYCNSKFRYIGHLRSHLLTSHLKSAPRPKCRYCDMTFYCEANKCRHEKRHKDPKAFELTCKVCYNRFNSKKELDAHCAKHRDSQKRICGECGETFPSKYFLVHHKRKKHLTAQEVTEKEKMVLLKEGLSEYTL